MSTARDRDLERWEQGGLSTAELVALYGSDGVAGLVALHRRMSALGAVPVGDPEKVWRAVRERLPVRVHPRRTGSLRRRLTRPLAIAAAAVLIAGTAYASSPDSVQRSLTSFWHKVQAILDVDVAGKVPADAHRPSDGGRNGDGAAGAVDDGDLEDRDDGEANDVDGSSGISDGDGSEAEGDDENGSDDDGEGHGADDGDDEGDEPDDDGDEPEDEGDEPDDEGNEADDEGNETDDDGDEPEDLDEDD